MGHDASLEDWEASLSASRTYRGMVLSADLHASRFSTLAPHKGHGSGCSFEQGQRCSAHRSVILTASSGVIPLLQALELGELG